MEIENDPYERARMAEAAKHMTTHDETEPTWMYRHRYGKVESRIFPAAEIPEGWYDSPAAIPEKPGGVVAEADKIMPKRGPGRPKGSGRKVMDDNG